MRKLEMNREQLFKEDTSFILPKTEIGDLIYDGYADIDKKQYQEAIEKWTMAWNMLKKLIQEYTERENPNTKIELLDFDESTNFIYELYEWLPEMVMQFQNIGEHEQTISFCKEILELFSWETDSPCEYKAGIGEALNSLGKIEERDAWYEEWLEQEPDNIPCINSYAWCLIEHGELEEAKELLEKYIGNGALCNEENDILFIRAVSLYSAIGDQEKANYYQEKFDGFQNQLFDEKFFDEYDIQKPIVKEKRIYPNEPCPCGSGKKYKKCCGRK